MLDTGTSMILFGLRDYKLTVDALCKFVNENENYKKLDPAPKCVGQGGSAVWNELPLSISGCTPAVVEEMPHIKFQFDAYNFDLRPKRYLDYMSINTRLVDYDQNYEVGWCGLQIFPHENDSGMLIGAPFLNDYY